MISTATRALCALLSTLGTAGLVMFANPANGMGATSHAPAAAMVAAATSSATSLRG